MPGGYAYGWTGAVWTQLLCNVDGELLIDSAAIFEDTPSDDELEKGPTSNWAYDHENDVDAHHVKYTDANSRAAINDIFNSAGVVQGQIDMNYNLLNRLPKFTFIHATWPTQSISFGKLFGNYLMYGYGYLSGTGFQNTDIMLHDGTSYHRVVREDRFQMTLDDYLDNPPTEDSANTAPTSEWAFDHDADVAAHHAKYTNAEAIAACGLDGDLYHTIPGLDFRPADPNGTTYNYESDAALKIGEDNIDVYCPVKLPDKVTVTAVKVNGNAGATSQTWTLYRYTLAAGPTAMASAVVGTEDTTISDPVIDNSAYMYFINIVGLDTDDEINSVVIKYTL